VWACTKCRPESHSGILTPSDIVIMSEKTKPGEVAPSAAATPQEQVPDWLGNRLRRMFTDVMEEPVPDEFQALLKQLEEKERGS
jgi:hypothetical protein